MIPELNDLTELSVRFLVKVATTRDMTLRSLKMKTNLTIENPAEQNLCSAGIWIAG